MDVDDLPLKTLLGVGSIGKLIHVGVLRMLSLKSTLNGRGIYYYQLLREEDRVLQQYEKYISMA